MNLKESRMEYPYVFIHTKKNPITGEYTGCGREAFYLDKDHLYDDKYFDAPIITNLKEEVVNPNEIATCFSCGKALRKDEMVSDNIIKRSFC
jgi:hypothetical protein